METFRRDVLFVLFTLSSQFVFADVQVAEDDLISISTSVECALPPRACWAALTQPSLWWGSSHTWSGDAANLSMDPTPGGGFDEKLPSGGFVRHMEVIYSDPDSQLRMSGVLGPLQEHALQGTMTIKLTADGDTTTISMIYRVSGRMAGGLGQIAPVVDQVLQEQFHSLKRQIEQSRNVDEKQLPCVDATPDDMIHMGAGFSTGSAVEGA
jgi:uncharacterized protein YndB with AHSA1/START domain